MKLERMFISIIMVIPECYFSIEHIALSLEKNGVSIKLGKPTDYKFCA